MKNQSVLLLIVFLLTLAASQSGNAQTNDTEEFSFIVAADMREFAGPEYQNSQFFRGAVEAMKKYGEGAFMVSPGDLDPPWHVRSTLDDVLGKDYKWYPVMGNHEQETPEDMEWLRDWGKNNKEFLLRTGPKNAEETFYSFDYINTHFVAINQYYDGQSDIATKGDISDPVYNWLQEDLAANDKQFIFVIGHEPIISIMDYTSGRLRHKGDNLDQHPENANRFVELLRKHNVTAYFCGHTHNFSYAKINGVWQLDAGHSRGKGDTGSPSTFLKMFVGQSGVWFEVYRDDANGGEYNLLDTIYLD